VSDDTMIPLGDQSVPASHVDAVVLATSRIVMVVTKGGNSYIAPFPLVREAKAAKLAFEAAWNVWRATQ
jgi:hypothetical protein